MVSSQNPFGSKKNEFIHHKSQRFYAVKIGLAQDQAPENSYPNHALRPFKSFWSNPSFVNLLVILYVAIATISIMGKLPISTGPCKNQFSIALSKIEAISFHSENFPGRFPKRIEILRPSRPWRPTHGRIVDGALHATRHLHLGSLESVACCWEVAGGGRRWNGFSQPILI